MSELYIINLYETSQLSILFSENYKMYFMHSDFSIQLKFLSLLINIHTFLIYLGCNFFKHYELTILQF